jgi:hypothetical protein
MLRAPSALLAGLAGFVAYAAGAVWLADQLAPMHWAVQALYFLVAGVLWVVPARWLMIWAFRRR